MGDKSGVNGPFDGGNFWITTAETASLAYAFSFWSTKVYPARSSTSPEANTTKAYGFTVRYVGSTRVNDILHQFPFSLPYSGYVYSGDGKVSYQGTGGYWWSQGANSNTRARALNILGNYTVPEDTSYKTLGFSVRCVVFLQHQFKA